MTAQQLLTLIRTITYRTSHLLEPGSQTLTSQWVDGWRPQPYVVYASTSTTVSVTIP